MQIKFSQQNWGLLSIIQQLLVGDAAGKAGLEQPPLPTLPEKAGWDLAWANVSYLLAVGSSLVMKRWTEAKASMNLYPDSLQSHLHYHAAKILLRAPKLPPSSSTSCKGPIFEAICNITGSDACWSLKQ